MRLLIACTALIYLNGNDSCGKSIGGDFIDGIRTLFFGKDTAATFENFTAIARSLLPLAPAGPPESVFFPSAPPKRSCLYIANDEANPTRTVMTLHRSDTALVPNAFELLAGFELTSAPSLRMPPPPSSSAPLLLRFPESNYSPGATALPLAEDPFIPGAKVEMKIVAFPGTMQFSTVELVGALIDPDFDRVWKTTDLERFGATAVRCRQRSVFRNVAGTYFAFIAFDAGVSGGPSRLSISPIICSSGKKAVPVRYLITLRSEDDVEDKAEHLLQCVLDRFDRGG